MNEDDFADKAVQRGHAHRAEDGDEKEAGEDRHGFAEAGVGGYGAGALAVVDSTDEQEE